MGATNMLGHATKVIFTLVLGVFIVETGAMTSSARAESQLTVLKGSWHGLGRVHLQDGKTEKIKCKAYYTGSGLELRQAIKCASTSYKVEIRSQLVQSGGKLTGTWEERTYNASGEAVGEIKPGKLTLNVTGGGFSGNMLVNFKPKSQSITITTGGIALKKVTMSLTKF